MGIFDDFKASLTAETPEAQTVNPLGGFGQQQRSLAAEPQNYGSYAQQPTGGYEPAGQGTSAASYPSYPNYPVEEESTQRDQEWIMPEYEGAALYEWIPVIQRAKAENDYDDALTIAYGCMDAMISVAQENPQNVMDFYVIQLADLYAELGQHDKVIEVISEWLNYNLPAPREDLRLALYKRLAKSQALAVKEAGNSAEICMVYNAEWRRLVEEERILIENAPDWSHIPITGKALATSKKPASAPQAAPQAELSAISVPDQLVQAIGAPGQPQPQAPVQQQQAQHQPQIAAPFGQQLANQQQPFAQDPEFSQPVAAFEQQPFAQEQFAQPEIPPQGTQFGTPEQPAAAHFEQAPQFIPPQQFEQAAQFGAAAQPQFGQQEPAQMPQQPPFGAPEQFGQPSQSSQFGAAAQPQFTSAQFGQPEVPQQFEMSQFAQPHTSQDDQGFSQEPVHAQQPVDLNNQYGAESLSAQYAPNFQEYAQPGQFGAPEQPQFEVSQQFEEVPQFEQAPQFAQQQQFEQAPQFAVSDQQQFGGAQFASPAQEQFTQPAPQQQQFVAPQHEGPSQFEAPQFGAVEQSQPFGAAPSQFAQDPTYGQPEQQSQFAQDPSYGQYGQPAAPAQQFSQPGGYSPQSGGEQGGAAAPFGVPAETPKQELLAGVAPQTTQWSSKRFIPEYNFTAGTLLFPMPSFVAVKFEVANRDPKSLCRVVLLKVDHGEVTGKVDSYVRPPAGVSPFEFSHIHGITEQTVEDAPQWPALAMHLRSFVGDYPVWANSTAMHAEVWRSLDDYFSVDSRPLEFYDSLLSLYRVEPQLQGVDAAGALAAIAPNAQYNPDAFGDALACSAIVQYLNQVNGNY